MVNFSLFAQSVFIGLAIAVPVDPIGILCIQRTLAYGMIHGFVSGLGAATADAIYGLMIAFGLLTLSSFVLYIADGVALMGGLFLFYLGFKTITTPITPELNSTTVINQGLWKTYLSTFALTISNPMTILAFIGIFSGIGGDLTNDAQNNGVIVLGIFTGSLLWWIVLSGGVSLLRTWMTPQILKWINRLSGAVIGLFAIHIILNIIGIG